MQKTIETYFSDNKKRTAIIKQNEDGVYLIDFYDYDVGQMVLTTRLFENKSLYYVQDAAENYIQGILNVSETA